MCVQATVSFPAAVVKEIELAQGPYPTEDGQLQPFEEAIDVIEPGLAQPAELCLDRRQLVVGLVGPVVVLLLDFVTRLADVFGHAIDVERVPITEDLRFHSGVIGSRRSLVSGATVNDDGGVTFVEDEIGQDANDPTPAAGRGIAL